MKARRIIFIIFFLAFSVLALTVSQAGLAASKPPLKSTPKLSLPSGIQSFVPTGIVADNVSFRVVFKNPVVTRQNTDKSLEPGDSLFPFTVEPSVQIEGKWQNEKTFTARLLNPLRNATSYTAALKSGLKDRNGNKIGPGSFKFQTEPLTPGDIRASMGRDGRAYFDLNFNMRVDPARLKGFLNVLNAQGRELAYKINGSLPGKTIRVSVPISQTSSRQKFTVKIAAGLKSSEGDLGIENDYSESVVLDPTLMIEELYGDEKAIRVSFNFGIDPETAKSFITVEPSVKDLTLESGYSDELLIIRSKEFLPRNRFVITFKHGLPAKGGLVLKEDLKQAIIMPDLDSEVSLPASGTYLTALDKGLVPIELLNVKKLQIDLWRLYENNIPYVVQGDYDYFQKNLARRVFTSEVDLTSLPLNERVRRSIPIEEIAKGERGLFLLTARDSEKEYWDEAAQMLNLSNIGVVARVWEDGILIWANTLTDAKAIPDAEVRIYSGSNQLLASGTTNIGGIYFFECKKGETWSSTEQPELAVISKREGKVEDITYVQLNRNLLNREIFDTAGRPWLKSGYDAAIFSPRDIYRTGESANFKAVVRNYDISVPEPFPVLFIVKDTLSRKVKQESVMLSPKGSAVFNVNLPSNALTGVWNVSLAIPGHEDTPLATYNFHVEDFVPPRIDVKVTTAKEFLTRNDIFTADIRARWLFGADADGLPYRTSWTASEGEFTPSQDRWKGFSFGDPSRKFPRVEGTIGDENENRLDSSGYARSTLTLDEDWEAPTIIDVTIRTDVMEDGGRWNSGSITRKYYPASWLLGIAATSDKMSVRQDLNFKIAAVTPNESPADPGELKAEFYRVSWNYNLIEIDGHKRWQSTEELLKISEKSVQLQNGLGSVSFRPEEYGTYLVRVSDSGDNARAVYRFFADDPQYAASGSQLIDRVEIEPDKEFYRPGDTAKIKINVPFEGLLLINVEGAKLISRKIQKVSSSELTIEIPVSQDFVPNAWISAWLIRPVQVDDSKAWGTHRAIGLTKIKTDLSDYRINVEIDAPEKTEPAQKLPVKINLGSENRNADVMIALVDDAVLSLTGYKTPDLLNYFWGIRKLNSKGFDIYDQLIPVEDRATEQLHPSGGEAMAALAGNSDIQRFKILSLFNGSMSTDWNGEIKTELDLPEFTGRGRLFIVATSGKKFGTAEKSILIKRDINAEVSLPRFVTPGDSFTVPAVIFNTSDIERDVKLDFVPEGMTFIQDQAQNENDSRTVYVGAVSSNRSGNGTAYGSGLSTALKIAPGSSEKFEAQVKVLDSDTAKLKIQVSWQEQDEADATEKKFTQEIELPVRQAWPSVTLAGSGTFENGETKLNLPLENFSGKVTGSLTLANTPAVDLNKAVNFLQSYPYACLEQTISTAWPFLILPDAVSELDPLLINSESIKYRTEGAITRIQAMQLYDGSFTMWPGGEVPYNWGSVYATHFLLAAKDAGINYPEEMLTGALNWLKQFLASMPEYRYPEDEYDDLTAKSYAVYVLALNGERPLGWIEYLRENQSMMWPSGLIWLAGAQALIDGRADALRNLSLGTHSGSSCNTLESETRNTAVLLSLWLDIEPQAQEVLELASRLIKLGEQNEWHSTQDNAWALISLARFGTEVGSSNEKLKATLTTDTDDTALISYSDNKATSIRAEDIPGSGLLIEAEGAGKGYYSWNISGIPKSQPKPERKNINVELSYYDEFGNIIDLTKPIRQGETIRAVLTLKPGVPVSNLALSYLLPAGFELENPRLENGSDNIEHGSYGAVNDVRDDRLILFFGRVDNEMTYGFRIRAVTRGTFAFPQISAYGMYDPSVRFIGRAQPDIIIR